MVFISTLTALVFYRRWWSKAFKIETGQNTNKLIRSIHRVVGIWSVPFILLIAVISMWYFAERADIGGIKREVNPRHAKLVADFQQKYPNMYPFKLDYDKAISIAEQAIPNFKVGNISPAIDSNETIYLMGTGNAALVRQRANRVYINPYDYSIVKVQNAKKISNFDVAK